MKQYPYVQINSINELPAPEEGTGLVGHYAFQYIDFTVVPQYALGNTFVDCCFFGCEFCPEQKLHMKDCLVFPRMGMEFHAFSPCLYTADSLYEGYVPGKAETFHRSYDARVYANFLETGEFCEDLKVSLARTLHDHSIYDAMADFLRQYDLRKVVGIMGGHGIKRDSEGYRKIVSISKTLTEKGRLMVSGGGPGAMEATHLGAWMAGRTEQEVDEAVAALSETGEVDPVKWLDSALEIKKRFPQDKYSSLSIPTWLYGHEPSTPFATHIAKFFTNSVREDMILSVTLGGIIFTPGSAGTMQEIFQNASKLHYDNDGIVGPMIFLGEKFFTSEVPVYPFLKDLLERDRYKNLHLSLTDEAQVAINNILNFSL